MTRVARHFITAGVMCLLVVLVSLGSASAELGPPPPAGGGYNPGGPGGSGGWGGGGGGGYVPWGGCGSEVSMAWSEAMTGTTMPPYNSSTQADVYVSGDGPNDFYNYYYAAGINTTGSPSRSAPWIILSDEAQPPGFGADIYHDDYDYACVKATPGTPPGKGYSFSFNAKGLETPTTGKISTTSHLLVYHAVKLSVSAQPGPTDMFLTGTAPDGSTFTAGLEWLPLIDVSTSPQNGLSWSPGDATSATSGATPGVASETSVACVASGVKSCSQIDENMTVTGTLSHTYTHVSTGVTPSASVKWVAACMLKVEDPVSPSHDVNDPYGSIACYVTHVHNGVVFTPVAIKGWAVDGYEYNDAMTGPTHAVVQLEPLPVS